MIRFLEWWADWCIDRFDKRDNLSFFVFIVPIVLTFVTFLFAIALVASETQ